MSPMTVSLLILAVLCGSVVGQPYSFVMNVLDAKFSACYMQLFEQAVNDLAIKNNSQTTQISFSTSLSSLAISSCASTTINIQTTSTSHTFATSLVFPDAPTCLKSIASYELGIATAPAPSSSCYCSKAYAGWLNGYSSSSSIVCNVTVNTSWNDNKNKYLNDQLSVTYVAQPNPVAYPSAVLLKTTSDPEAAVELEVADKLVESADEIVLVKEQTAVAPPTDDLYAVYMYVLLRDFATCVPSLFAQNVNDLNAKNMTTSVYVTFSTSLAKIDVSACNFNQIGIQALSTKSSFTSGLAFARQSDCSSSVASNSIALSAGGRCNTGQCVCNYGCNTDVLTGVTTASTNVCNISLGVSWTVPVTAATTHVYTMLASPAAYPVSFAVNA
eukprot:TRINITY_DN3804_c0_g1_i2.p1 TRINITY_DN3804_c0_g1~~TRINITY_DN3804_c0_g1_i2.p1  ORF type:complete len:386 (-),score=111.09 TRINITY_DN3804_c0_g1_i2:74-1231(-)